MLFTEPCLEYSYHNVDTNGGTEPNHKGVEISRLFRSASPDQNLTGFFTVY